jgi:hypothetical protein
MDQAPEEKKTSLKGTPAWLKRSLLVLLFASAAIGFIYSTRWIFPSTNGAAKFSGSKPVIKNNSFATKPFRSESAPQTILCQGLSHNETRGTKAVINGKVVDPGSVIDGVRVLEITTSNVLVECRGETRRLAPGERFSPKKP